MNTIQPYIPKATKDTITSEDWNNIQIFARTALQEHDHSGTGDKAKPIGANGIAAGSIATDHLQDKSVTNKKIKKVNANKLTGAIKVSKKTNTIAMNQGIQIGGAPDNAPEGTIRWTGKDFEGKIGNQWLSLTMDSDSIECDSEDSEDSEKPGQDTDNDNEQNTNNESDTQDKPKEAKNRKKRSNDN